MSILDSLKTLGIRTEDVELTMDGINRLIISREQKLKLAREYASDKGIVLTIEQEKKLE